MQINEETTMERTPRNAAKIEILNILKNMGDTTSWQIALITNRTPEAASMALLRYHSMGLVSRRTLTGRTKIYDITDRGLARLAWLNQRESNELAYVES